MADPRKVAAAVDVGRQTGIFPLDPSVDEQVWAAQDEIRDLPKVPYPSTASVVMNHPGVIGYQVMTDPEYQQAAKYDMLMRRLGGIQAQGRYAYRDSEAAQNLEPNPEPLPGSSASSVAPYRYRGFFAEGQPVRNAVDVINIPFAAVGNNVVRPFFNLDRAAEVQPKQLNKATGGLYNAFRGEDPNPQWSDEQRFVEGVRFDSPLMLGSKGNPSVAWEELKKYTPQQETGAVSGDELLGDMGMQEGAARFLLGAAIETPLDPFTTAMGPMAKYAARASRYASPAARNAALRGFGSEAAKEFVLPPAVLTGLLEAAKYGAQQ